MSSPKFERVKRSNPRLAGLLDRLVRYIDAQVQEGQSYIIPKLAGAALHLSDSEAVVLLETLAKGDLVQRIYNVYCRKNNTLVATVDEISALDELPRCDDCDVEHASQDLKVEIAYRPKNGTALGAVA